MYPEGGNDARKCESENHSSLHSLKMRFTPKIPHADTLLVSFNAILRQPRAKIIASRLHYTLLSIATDNFT